MKARRSTSRIPRTVAAITRNIKIILAKSVAISNAPPCQSAPGTDSASHSVRPRTYRVVRTRSTWLNRLSRQPRRQGGHLSAGSRLQLWRETPRRARRRSRRLYGDGGHTRVVASWPEDRPHCEARRQAEARKAERQADAAKQRGKEGNRHPDHPPSPALRAESLEQLSPRLDLRVAQIDHGRCCVELSSAPGDDRCGAPDLAGGEGESRPTQAQVPAAEQLPTHESRQLRVSPIEERRRSENPRLDAEWHRFRAHDPFRFSFPPGIRTELPSVGRSEGRALVKVLPGHPWRAQDGQAAHVYKLRESCCLHRAEHVAGRLDGVASVVVVPARGLGGGVHDDSRSDEHVERRRAAQIQPPPLVHVRVLRIRRATNATHPVATVGKLAGDRLAEEAACSGEDCERRDV